VEDAPPVRFGSAVASVGDVNGDGVPDVVVAGYAQANARGYPSGGQARVFSGKDGSPLFSLPVVAGDPQSMAPDFGEGVPSAAGAGDLNGDGKPDIVLGVPLASPGGLRYAGQVLVCSGKDGKPLLAIDGTGSSSTFGSAVAFLGDVDGDGKVDIAAGAPEAGDAGVVGVFSGKDGKFLFGVKGTPNSPAPEGATVDVDHLPGPPMFGWAIAAVGDLDRDGRPDFAVGAIYAMPSGRRSEGRVQVFSGKDRSVLRTFDPPKAVEPGLCGYSVAAVGDLNGDGVPDVATGLPFSGAAKEGRALVFSGRDGQVLLSMRAPGGGTHFGASVAGAGDVNGDGVPDIVVGQPGWPAGMPGPGRAFVMSGKDGSLLRTLDCSRK
jgi:hypothetical protein